MSETLEEMLESFETLKEVAAHLGVSDSYVRRHSVGKYEPTIPFVKIARKIRFKVRDVEEFIAAQNPDN